MPDSLPFLTDFVDIPCRYSAPIAELHDWEAWRRGRAMRMAGVVTTDAAEEALREEFRIELRGRAGRWVKEKGFELEDLTHRDMSRMLVFHDRETLGARAGERLRVFNRMSTELLQTRFYPEPHAAPEAIILATNTSYPQPSAVHRLIDARKWNESTRPYHAYGAGCAGGLHSIRFACGVGPRGDAVDWAVDVAHVELSTIGMQLVDYRSMPHMYGVSAVYGDGLIRYTVRNASGGRPGFRIVAISEQVIPGSLDTVGINPGDYGTEPSGSPESTGQVLATTDAFVRKLFQKAGMNWENEKSRLILAPYLGTPMAVSFLVSQMEMEPRSIGHARAVYGRCGSMASATLPKIWSTILSDAEVSAGTPILSLAAAPGILLAGSIMIKE